MLHDWKQNIEWCDLDFELQRGARLVLRHNTHLQYGYTPKSGETLHEALCHMETYCKSHPKGNPKIVGLIKVVERTRLNNAPLWVKLRQLPLIADASGMPRAARGCSPNVL
jgi:hypothetical protein